MSMFEIMSIFENIFNNLFRNYKKLCFMDMVILRYFNVFFVFLIY